MTATGRESETTPGTTAVDPSGTSTTGTTGPTSTTDTGGTTDTDTTDTTDTATSAETTGGCSPGQLGCACLEDESCEGALVCVDELCAEPAPGLCGDGVVDRGEECDDGEENGAGAICLADCVLNVCGDGDLSPEEACDDGNLVDGDGCEADCTWTPCTLLWEKTLTEPGVTRQGRQIAADSAGNIVVVARYKPGLVESRMIVLKLTPDGELLWTEEAVDLRTVAYDVEVAEDDVIFAIGTEFEAAFTRDYTRRFEPDGALGWYRQEAIPEASHGFGLALSDDAVFIAGYRQIPDNNRPSLARLSRASGEVEWTNLDIPPGADFGSHYAVAVDPAGDLYTTGVVTTDNVTRLLLQKFSPAGNLVWMTQVSNPDPGFARGSDIATAPGGGVVVGGDFFYGNQGKTGGDMWVGRFDAEGELLWSDLHDGGPGQTYDAAESVAVGANGHVHVAGGVESTTSDRIYRRYDGEGELLCSVILESEKNHKLFGVALDPEGFVLLSGNEAASVYVAKMTP